MGTYIDPRGWMRRERRHNAHLRAIYPDARGRIEHFFHANQDWAGSSIDYLALRVIHEAYPDLKHQEVRALAEAIEAQTLKRVYAWR